MAAAATKALVDDGDDDIEDAGFGQYYDVSTTQKAFNAVRAIAIAK